MLLIAGLSALVVSTGLVIGRLFLKGSVITPRAAPVRRREDEPAIAPETLAPRAVIAPAVPVDAPVIAAKVAATAPAQTPAPSREESPTTPAVSSAPTPLSGLLRVVRGLRAEASPESGGLCLLVTGARRGVGATAAAISLSRLLADEGRAVLVDLDMSAPGLDGLVADADGDDAPVGFTDLLNGEAAFSDALHRDAASSLHVLPAGCSLLREGDHDAQIARIAGALRKTYDYVILDAASPAAQPQTIRCARHARAVIIVAPDPEHSADDIVGLLQQLPSSETCESLIYTPERVIARPAAEAA